MKIYLCRHGNREPNRSDRENPVHLTPLGWEQAAKLGAYLANELVDGIYCSPKARCVETATPLHMMTSLPILVVAPLIEHDSFGSLDFNMEWLDRFGHRFYPPLPRTMKIEPELSRAANDPTYERAKATIGRMRNGYERLAVFSHDCFNSVLIWAWLNRGPQTEADRYRQDECCVNILEDGKDPIINMQVV